MNHQIKATDKANTTHIIEAEENMSIMELLRDAGLVEGVCGGVCACATCHIAIGAQWVNLTKPQDEEETMLLEELPTMQEYSRLGCQIPFTPELDGMEVIILED